MGVNLVRVGWEDGTLVTPARVTVGGTTYDVTDAQYSGTTPLSSENIKKMETNTENALKTLNKGAFVQDDEFGYSANFLNNSYLTIITHSFSMGSFQAHVSKFEQTSAITIPQGYTPIGILGFTLSGAYFADVCFSTLDIRNNNSVYWSAKNTGSNATEEITAYVKVLLKRTGN